MVGPPQTRNVALELNTRSNAIGFHTKIEGLVHKFCSENFPTAGGKQGNRLQGGLSPGYTVTCDALLGWLACSVCQTRRQRRNTEAANK